MRMDRCLAIALSRAMHCVLLWYKILITEFSVKLQTFWNVFRLNYVSGVNLSCITHNTSGKNNVIHSFTHSHSISFFSLCLTQWGVDDCGHPVRVLCQYELTEASRVKARHSEWMDLPDIVIWRSSPASKSVWYSNRNVLISNVSSISTGRSLSVVYNNNHIISLLKES